MYKCNLHTTNRDIEDHLYAIHQHTPNKASTISHEKNWQTHTLNRDTRKI